MTKYIYISRGAKDLKFHFIKMFSFYIGIKQKWVPMDIEHPKSNRNGRRSRSAGRSPRTEPKSFDKRGRPEGGRFSKLKLDSVDILMHRSR